MKTNYKKLMILLLSILTATSMVLAGCGGGEPETTDAQDPADSVTEDSAQDTEEPKAADTAKSYDAEKDNHMSGNFINDGSYGILDNLWENNSEGITYLYGNDFLLTMPNNSKWGFEQTEADSFRVFYVPTRDNGMDGAGILVTITAYDVNDSSYEQLPMNYHVAGVGQNTGKRFIAIYPSDVQYDPENKEEAAGYVEMLNYLEKIAENAADSPFSTSDSNPAP